MWSPKKKKKKKKGHHTDGGIFFCDIPERGAVNRGCLRFLAGEKNARIRKNSVRKCQKKFRTFLRL